MLALQEDQSTYGQVLGGMRSLGILQLHLNYFWGWKWPEKGSNPKITVKALFGQIHLLPQ